MCGAGQLGKMVIPQMIEEQRREQARVERQTAHQAMLSEYAKRAEIANARSTPGVGSVRTLPESIAATASTAGNQQPGLVSANNAAPVRRGRGGLIVPGPASIGYLNIPTK